VNDNPSLPPFSPSESQDSSGKLTNDYWSKLQSRLKIEDDDEEENNENKAKDDEEIDKKFESSLANNEIVVEEQSH